MKEIKLKAYAKINLTLDVLKRLDNGYHDLRMVMASLTLYDNILLKKRENGIILNCDDSNLPRDHRNIAYKAAELLIKEFQIEGGVEIYIEKKIPVAAGMAGGSSNAAAVLKGMNELFALGLSPDELRVRGLTLGADVPYCLLGGVALAEGVGERLKPLGAMPHCYVAVSNPGISISTARVFNKIDEKTDYRHPDTDKMLEAIKEGDIYKVARSLGNVLEEVTTHMHPVIVDIKRIMQEEGALGSLMSGSGPTVFGLFEEKNIAEHAIKIIKDKVAGTKNFVVEFVETEVKDGN